MDRHTSIKNKSSCKEKMWKQGALSIMVAGLVILFIAGNTSPALLGEDDILYFSGITAGNIANRGLAARADDWIYFVDFFWHTTTDFESYHICKMRTDGSEKTKLSDDHGFFLNIFDNWIYYCAYDPIALKYTGIYKMQTDGSARTQISNDAAMGLQVEGDWIYYWVRDDSHDSSGGILYRARTDGTQRTPIVNANKSVYCIQNDWIYYIMEIDGRNQLCKIHMDGTGWTQLTNEAYHGATIGFFIEGAWIYYTDGTALYRLARDGSEDIQIFKDNGMFLSMNVMDGWIYYKIGYLNSSSDTAIRKVRTDGSENITICEMGGNYINIVGDWLYFINRTESVEHQSLYKVRTDGTELQSVSNWSGGMELPATHPQ